MNDPKRTIGVRMDAAMIAALEQHLAAMARPGLEIGISDVVRIACAEWLATTSLAATPARKDPR